MNDSLVCKQHRLEIRSYLKNTYRSDMAKDVYRGLTAPQKFIPSKYFYDARGSRLFEKICSLPEYYPTRTEMSILKHAAPHVMESFDRGDIVELGSGANWKIRMLLDAATDSGHGDMRYVPVDVSKTALIEASEELLALYAELEVLGIVADFMIHMNTIPCDHKRLIIFLGSTIGNFDEKGRRNFLRLVADSMRPGDRFLVGFDMIKSRETLEAAYNDSRGITSEFNKNILLVLNRELNANFDPSHFAHLAFFNEEKERVEMHLRAKRSVTAHINELGLVVDMQKDETIHTEVCSKFNRKRIEQMAAEAGLEITQWFSDLKEWFSLAELSLTN